MANRGHFSSKFGFIAAAAGSAVGLGNIWKFPFEVGQGGGALFLIIYLIFCFVLCYPILITEISIGRKSEKSAAVAFDQLGYKKWTFLGKLGVLCGVMILSFYNVVAGWVFGYFVEIVKGNFDIGNEFGAFTTNIWRTGIYSIAFLVFTTIIVSQGITKGIEKASKILMPVLIGIILLLVFYAFTLPNSGAGVEYYLVPDFSKLSLQVVYKALGQSFFSLSLGLGALITYGSYLERHENIVFSGALITLADVGIAFLAGLMIFPFVFYQGIDPEGGAALIFQTMPGIFESMGSFWGIFIGGLFFLLLSFAALTSTISLLELPVAYFVDQKKWKRKRAVWVSGLIIFLLGVPSLLGNGYSAFFTEFITYFGTDSPRDYMTFIGDVFIDTLLPLGGFLTAIFAIHVWKKGNLVSELSDGADNFAGSWLNTYIIFSLKYIAPVILGAIFIFTVLEKFFSISIL
ncbi:MAG TPA: sodium-dependent transporter [Cytophagales bacterium]|jgi:NSS family neurotransmitter:Na+ symporter|nr:sodium-dependent transporter [Cytophagales bacterium]